MRNNETNETEGKLLRMQAWRLPCATTWTPQYWNLRDWRLVHSEKRSGILSFGIL